MTLDLEIHRVPGAQTCTLPPTFSNSSWQGCGAWYVGMCCVCVCGLMASPAGRIVGGTGVPGTGYTASLGTAYVPYSIRVTSSSRSSSNSKRSILPDGLAGWLAATATVLFIPPTAVMQSTSGSDHGQDVLQPVYRDLHFPTRAHRSPAVLQVFPGPCTAPQTHRPPTDHPPLTTHHAPPHRARTTFGFECHASCPSLSPWPACSTLSRPPTPTLTPCPAHEPCPCPRFPSAAAAARALAPVPAP